ncbi:MAG: hypothetical protein ACREQ4_11115 [Candidatus Binataceae bacterium]
MSGIGNSASEGRTVEIDNTERIHHQLDGACHALRETALEARHKVDELGNIVRDHPVLVPALIAGAGLLLTTRIGRIVLLPVAVGAIVSVTAMGRRTGPA